MEETFIYAQTCLLQLILTSNGLRLPKLKAISVIDVQWSNFEDIIWSTVELCNVIALFMRNHLPLFVQSDLRLEE